MAKIADKVWHALPAEEVLRELRTSSEGLDGREAEQRLISYGPNALAEEKKTSAFGQFMKQFQSPLIYVLILASAISFAVGETVDGSVILLIVVFNAIIGFAQERKAEQALEALKQLAAPTAAVIRSGEEMEVASREVVPGDIIVVEAGDRIPADARLLEAVHLKTDEAALTGESVPVDKETSPLPEDTPLAERTNMVYSGTVVASGRGLGIVVATGNDTETGRIASAVHSAPAVETPIQRKLAQIGRFLAIVGVGIAFVLVVIGLIHGFSLYELFFTAVAVAVSFIPEGLPAVVTIVLAIGVQRMAKRNAIVRKLPAVEALGSATVIATDKTGTLTQNEMTVRACCTHEAVFEVTGQGYEPAGEFVVEGQPVDPNDYPSLMKLLTVAVLCNDARFVRHEEQWTVAGDPTEGALLVAAHKAGLRPGAFDDEYPRLDEIPFESERKYMATLNHSKDDGALICVKGAPEQVLGMCEGIYDGQRDVPLSEERRRGLLETNQSMAARAYRVLAIAYKPVPKDKTELRFEDVEHGLVFLGFMGMIDPPRAEVFEAVRAAKQAGIRIIMITGDNPVTAQAIASTLEILDDGEVVIGKDLERMTDDELTERIRHISVFARVEPQQKHRIVEALKRNGELVAMTGDGVNDAPALKRADIGISMGITGTDVAREASDIVLADDNFATIVAAVEEGRTIFANLRKVVQYLLATNTGEILTFLTAIATGFPLPLLPVQILWVNLVTDGFAATPLSVEPKEEDVLRQPPRPPKEPIITARMTARIAGVAVIMAIGTLLLFGYSLSRGIVYARTMAFATIAIFQLFNTLNARSPVRSVFRIGFFSNPWILVGVGTSFLLQISVIQLPILQRVFSTTTLSLRDWALVIGVSSSVWIVEEIRKLIAPHLFEKPADSRAVSQSAQSS